MSYSEWIVYQDIYCIVTPAWSWFFRFSSYCFSPARFGEQNACFSVATFSSDNEDDRDVAKKVTSALERVTSDYHSGSSSDEESTRSSPLSSSYRPHQVPSCTLITQELSSVVSDWKLCFSALFQTMNLAAPSWHPKKMVTGKCLPLPQHHYGYRPARRVPHGLRRGLWVPPVYGNGPAYWDTDHRLTHC